ncbi:GNAT family N-acetyltransferase [Ruicaihuangia caeni]|uniref:GNAT family N-acetyltransferase n=1 Tax=Ruicaihuangia caeni TaxID=3042517 RepID=A0AAW6TAN3_9MICO|nr:GNAT family N-acetyltransferase [Klugiella sp. YN-L-19]MDI2098177.1 GNAT family N-acetyltransferase [Klugiella sp. YN-L-19]
MTTPAPMRVDEGIVIAKNPDASRYELRDGDRVIGFAHYSDRNGELAFDHTVVGKEYGGRGLATRLAEYAFADVRSMGRTLVPMCSFIEAWARKHPEYDDIVVWGGADGQERHERAAEGGAAEAASGR